MTVEDETRRSGITGTDLRSLADRLTKKVEDAKSFTDPFAAHFFVSRRAYRVAVDTSGKSGSRIERALISSYQVAMNLGFKGSIRDWEGLLRICLPRFDEVGTPR